jgi:hypothetical protein
VPLKETVDRARENAINPPPPPPAFGGVRPGAEPPNANGEEPPPKGEKPEAGKKQPATPEEEAAAKGVHIHMGDINVRVPPADLPDIHLAIDARTEKTT